MNKCDLFLEWFDLLGNITEEAICRKNEIESIWDSNGWDRIDFYLLSLMYFIFLSLPGCIRNCTLLLLK